MRVRIYKVGNKYRAQTKVWYWPFWRWYRDVLPIGSGYKRIKNFNSLKEIRDHFKKPNEYTELLDEFNI